jgi:hypothetical protein
MITLQQKSLDLIAAARGPGGGGGSGGGNGGGGGGGPGGGGGGHTEPVGNNLSFPVIWAEGEALFVPAPAPYVKLTVPTLPTESEFGIDTNGDGVKDKFGFDTDGDDVVDTYRNYAFAQKTTGNEWQAQSHPFPVGSTGGPVYVTEIDWGDSLESVDMKVGRPVRVELSLYKNLATTYPDEAYLPATMTSFPMALIANPSSPDESKGVGSDLASVTSLDDVLKVDSPEATVYSAGAQLIIQKLVIPTDDSLEKEDLKWNGSQWVDANPDDPTDIGAPIGIAFAGELNVSGKVIYGLSQGGWKPTEVGDYRITFYLQPSVNTQLDYATIRQPLEEEIAAIAAEEGSDIGGGDAVVLSGFDPISGIDRNLTYIDISVVRGGGGGGGGGGGRGRPSGASNEIASLGAAEFNSFIGDPLQAQFRELDRICDPVAGLFPVATSDFL